MSDQKTLQRDDIVGKRIKNIYLSPWDSDPDGCGTWATYIELEDGTAFELQYDDYGVAHPIFRVDLNRVEATPTDDKELRKCIGQAVLEVLVCKRWPGIGLHVSSNYLIFRDAFHYDRGWSVGPFAVPIDHPHNRYKLSDTVPYWNQPSSD